MGPGDLQGILQSLDMEANPLVVIGPGDDAGVFSLEDGRVLVQTVDIITPVVDDPFTFGSVSAANSLSDVYAMGGRPVTAMALLGYPVCDYGLPVTKLILAGALDVLRRAGVALVGGHSFDDPEMKFGLSVTGYSEVGLLLKAGGARPGDVLVLTKPLGTGVLCTAFKGGKLDEGGMARAVASMLLLNDAASEAALEAKATSATDVTGFGLLGHAFNMVGGSDVDFEISAAGVPVFEGVRDFISEGIVPEGAYTNLKYLQDMQGEGGAVDLSRLDEDELLVLTDPQTSGGLLVTVPEQGVRVFADSGVEHSVIGAIKPGTGVLRVVA